MLRIDQKEYCANNLSSICISRLRELFPNIRYSKIVSDFIDSKTYDLLYEFDTGLWAEGPEYILNEYLQELKNKGAKKITVAISDYFQNTSWQNIKRI